ncbi:hypothetical protein GCM10027341_53800 [Spirosoma knui]
MNTSDSMAHLYEAISNLILESLLSFEVNDSGKCSIKLATYNVWKKSCLLSLSPMLGKAERGLNLLKPETKA